MRNLDGTIKMMEGREVINTLGERTMTESEWGDILYYLKEFQKLQRKIEIFGLGNITNTLNGMENPPIPWDKLDATFGRPVWIQYMNQQRWEISEGVDDDIFTTNMRDYKKSQKGIAWQAYRKEKNEKS